MRIDPNSSIGRILGIRPKSAVRTEATATSPRDSVELSTRAEDLRVALDALKEAPAVREELVATLRRQIEQGTFDTSAEALARKLLDGGQPPRADE